MAGKKGAAGKSLEIVAVEKMAMDIRTVEELYSDGMPYELERIENEIRFYQEQAGTSLIEMGKRFIRIKKHEEHGRFLKTIENVNMSLRSVDYAMAAALKFSNSQTFANLGASKMIALSVLDDDDVQKIAAGGDIGGMKLDDIDRMSVRELREHLRKERESRKHDREVQEKAIAQKEAKINELDGQLRYLPPISEEEKAEKAIETRLKELRKDLFTNIQLARLYFGKTLETIETATRLDGVTFPQLEKWAREEYEELAGFNELFEQLDDALNYINPDKGDGERS
ncbi:MAG: DUF3102 domain-containing protein [Spirochaetota bacterium]|jgi:hypothetical protein|nr:DUF3102 domain-containing protein [Spirochaetota bacterium]